MKLAIFLILCLSLVIGSATNAAVFMKYDDIDGESTDDREAVSTRDISQTATTSVPGSVTTPTNSQEGKVEMGWKVEEGESAAVPGVEPDEIDVKNADQPTMPDLSILLGGGSEKAAEVRKEALEKAAEKNPAVIEFIVRTDGEAEQGDAQNVETIILNGAALRGLEQSERDSLLRMAPTSSAAVFNETDLAFIAARAINNDAAIEQISLNYEKIKVKREAKGKLFMFIPISFIEEIKIDTAGDDFGRVSVALPWYSFLVKEDLGPNQIALEVAGRKGWEKWLEASDYPKAAAAVFDALIEALK